MIVVDTSAWVEFLRATGSRQDAALATAIEAPQNVLLPDVVRLELLAGAGDDVKALELQRFLARFPALASSSPADHDLAASLYRSVRAGGNTVRSLLDCLVAAMALRHDVPLLARDRDFDLLARVSSLQLV